MNAAFALVIKKDCPTCALIAPIIPVLAESLDGGLAVYVQDDPAFPGNCATLDDRELEFSWRNEIEIVPTLLRRGSGGEYDQRIIGWDRAQWREFTAMPDLGEALAPFRPGCGSRTLDPGMPEKLAALHAQFGARRIALASAEDDMESCFERGWTDGLPVVPPTPERVMRMLAGTAREASEVIGEVPPDRVPCSIEKLAINAVLAGCKPEYFPLVIAAVEAALDDRFCMHGLLCTTYFSSPVVIVNGPAARQVGMNAGVNALGQGNRANATIGRALQLVIRNVGGGVPGGIDRAALGNPGKYTYCFAEDESDPDWPSLAMDRGFAREDSVVSLFAGEGLQAIVDQQSREPESLAGSFAASLRTVVHYKLYGLADAILVVSPEHRRVFREAGWTRADLQDALAKRLRAPAETILRGVDGIAEGVPERLRGKQLSKFRKGGLHIVSLGGTAGMFSAIIGGWVAAGERGSQMVSHRIDQQFS